MTQIKITDWSYWAGAWAKIGTRAGASNLDMAGSCSRDYKLVKIGALIHDTK